MKLVSFDVGLRNLAFCVLEGTSRTDLTITAWDLIDVMAEMGGLDKPLCHKCKKPACWKQDSLFACTRHKGKSVFSTKAGLQKMKKEELVEIATTMSLQISNTKKDLIETIYSASAKRVWKRCVKSAKQGSVVDLAPAIAFSLKERESIWKNADLIAFEQQPDKRMLCVQGMLHMWFVTQGYRCKGVSAVHKLTNMVTIQDATKTYKGRKKTGIVHAAELVPTEELKTFMLKHPKKDDLADSFLQGLWVLENTRIS